MFLKRPRQLKGLGLALVRGHKEGAHLWGVREEKHHLLRVMASVSADREARERKGHLTGPQKGLHPSCSSQGTHFPHTIQAASFRGGKTFPPSFPNWRTVARLRWESLGLGSLVGRRKRKKPDKVSKENDELKPHGKLVAQLLGSADGENRVSQFQSWRESTLCHQA